MTGIPSSGKTTRTLQLKVFFEDVHKKQVHVVSEHKIITESGNEKNALFSGKRLYYENYNIIILRFIYIFYIWTLLTYVVCFSRFC